MNRLNIAFDFDGTILDSSHIFVEEMNKLSRALSFRSLPIDKDEQDSLRGMTLKEFLKFLGISYWKLPLIVYFAKKNVRRRLREFREHDGVMSLLEDLSADGHNVGIITSNREDTVREYLGSRMSSVQFLVSDVGLFSKPKALKRWKKRNIGKCVYVGDEIRDIEASKKAGCVSVAVTWGHNSKEALSQYDPDFLCGTTEELSDVLRNSI